MHFFLKCLPAKHPQYVFHMVLAIMNPCLLLNLLLLLHHPIKPGKVSEGREPTNCNSLCSSLLCLLPLAACRVSDARDIGFLGMRRKQKCCPITTRYRIPTTMSFIARRQIHSQQPMIQCIPGGRNIRGAIVPLT